MFKPELLICKVANGNGDGKGNLWYYNASGSSDTLANCTVPGFFDIPFNQLPFNDPFMRTGDIVFVTATDGNSMGGITVSNHVITLTLISTEPFTPDEQTVGSVGAKYPTVSAAFSAGAYNLRVISNATDADLLVLPANVSINVQGGATWTMNGIQYGSSNQTLIIGGEGTIKWSPTEPSVMINGSTAQDSYLHRKSINIDGSESTSDECSIYQVTTCRSEGITYIKIPDKYDWGIDTRSSGYCLEDAQIVISTNYLGEDVQSGFGCIYTGGGGNQVQYFAGLTFEGYWGESGIESTVITIGDCIVENVNYISGSGSIFPIYVQGVLRGFTAPAGKTCQIQCADGAVLINLGRTSSAIQYIYSTGNITMQNVVVDTLGTLGDGTIYDNVIVGVNGFPRVDGCATKSVILNAFGEDGTPTVVPNGYPYLFSADTNQDGLVLKYIYNIGGAPLERNIANGDIAIGTTPSISLTAGTNIDVPNSGANDYFNNTSYILPVFNTIFSYRITTFGRFFIRMTGTMILDTTPGTNTPSCKPIVIVAGGGTILSTNNYLVVDQNTFVVENYIMVSPITPDVTIKPVFNLVVNATISNFTYTIKKL